jgi:hypothetical protein
MKEDRWTYTAEVSFTFGQPQYKHEKFVIQKEIN